MIKQIPIPKNIPRDPAKFKGQIDLMRGLRVYYFFGYLFLFGMALPISAAFMPPYETGLILYKAIVSPAFFVFLSYLFFYDVGKRYKGRVAAFKSGELVNGKVISHRRKFVPWKSWRDYVDNVEFVLKDGSKIALPMQSTSEELFRRYPVGGSVQALVEPKGKYFFFPYEVGVEFTYQ